MTTRDSLALARFESLAFRIQLMGFLFFICVSWTVKNFFPFSVFEMYSTFRDSKATSFLLLDAHGKSHDVLEYHTFYISPQNTAFFKDSEGKILPGETAPLEYKKIEKLTFLLRNLGPWAQRPASAEPLQVIERHWVIHKNGDDAPITYTDEVLYHIYGVRK